MHRESERRVSSGRVIQAPAGRLWRMNAVVFLLALALLGAVFHAQYAGTDVMRRYSSMLRTVGDVLQKTTEAHLWFAEILSGDPAEDPNKVKALLDDAMNQSLTLLHGEPGRSGSALERPEKDKDLRKALGGLIEAQALFGDFLQRHWSRIPAKHDNAGMRKDKELDVAFNLVLSRAHAVSELLNKYMLRQRTAMHTIQNAVMAAIVILSVLLAASLHHFVAAQERDRKRVEQGGRQMGTILDALGEAVLGLGADGEVLLMNPAARALTGWHSHEAVGRPLGEIIELRPAPEKPPLDLGDLDALCRMPPGTPPHLEMRARDGSRRSVSAGFTAVSGETGAGVAYICVLRDVGEHLRMQEFMAQSDKMLSVGGLASGMAHEINNPLAGILQSAQNIRRRVLDDVPRNREAARATGCSLDAVQAYFRERQVDRMIDGIRELSQRAAGIVANLLEFSHDGSGERSPHDLGGLAAEALALVRGDRSLRQRYKTETIRFSTAPSAAPLLVECSAQEIRQALFNVLRNAVQAVARAGGGGEITLRARAVDGMAQIEIRDTGPGMDEAVRKRAFEPFFTTLPTGEGHGLGLAVAYFIVTRNHEGRIEIDSRPGEGASVRIRLPLA